MYLTIDSHNTRYFFMFSACFIFMVYRRDFRFVLSCESKELNTTLPDQTARHHVDTKVNLLPVGRVSETGSCGRPPDDGQVIHVLHDSIAVPSVRYKNIHLLLTIPNWTWWIKIGVKLLEAHFTDIKISRQMWTIWTILIKIWHSNFILFYLMLNTGILEFDTHVK